MEYHPLKRKRTMKLTKEDSDWAFKVKERDGWGCVVCGSQDRLNAHHLIPRENKEFKHDIDNGISLCPLHHMFSREISAHNNPIAFIKFMLRCRPEQMEKAFARC